LDSNDIVKCIQNAAKPVFDPMRFCVFLGTLAAASGLFGCVCPAEDAASQKRDEAIPAPKYLKTKLAPGCTIPVIDVSGEKHRQVIADREVGQYLGHRTTVLLEDGRTAVHFHPGGVGSQAEAVGDLACRDLREKERRVGEDHECAKVS
jgi:hypothetical protein